jgi:hypothetical protein
MGKSGGGRVVYRAPKRGGKGRHCLGCYRPIVYGDRCPPCAQLVRTRAAKRRRRR